MLKLNVGFNRKTGEANYGSRGASVNLEIEVESGLVREPDKLQSKIDYLFGLAKASVETQLNGGNPPQQPQPAASSNGSGNNGANGNGANGNGTHASAGMSPSPTNGDGNGSGHYSQGNGTNGRGNGSSNGNGHRASEKQMNFVTQLAKGIRGLGTRRLDSLTGRMFGKPLADLSTLDASSLIDTLKAIKEGRVSLDAAVSEGAPA